VGHGLPRRSAFRAAILAIVLSLPLLVAAELGDRPPPITISVDGRTVVVAHRTTFGRAIRELSLRASDGRLLDIDGGVLERNADPGEIRLNGEVAPRSSLLEPGDSIVVAPGTDQIEGTRRIVERLPGQQLGNPIFTLAPARMEKISTVGRVSGIVADVRYRAIGSMHRPPTVALTFDDGPWPHTTRQVLGILERMHAKATFFMVGYLIERYPEIVRRVERSGMTIGTHSWSHPYRTPFVDLTPHRIETEVQRPAELLQSRFGITPTLFRAPGGSYDPQVVRVAREAGMRLVQWSVDPNDYRDSASPGGIASSVLRAVRPGSVVLLHDGGGDQSATVRALPRIIRGIRDMGLELVTIEV
jgi:peptidoglycan/xylan/chitin deacetylase (PgdA/CDA1 family)